MDFSDKLALLTGIKHMKKKTIQTNCHSHNISKVRDIFLHFRCDFQFIVCSLSWMTFFFSLSLGANTQYLFVTLMQLITQVYHKFSKWISIYLASYTFTMDFNASHICLLRFATNFFLFWISTHACALCINKKIYELL